MDDHQQAMLVTARSGRTSRVLRRSPSFWIGVTLVGTLVAAAILAPVIAPHDPDQQFRDVLPSSGAALGPTTDFPLGTDRQGRDYLSRILYGARTTLAIALVANVAAAVIGLAVGLVAGYFSRAGGVLMRITDFALAFPILLLALAMAAVLGRSVALVTFIIAAVVWAAVARLVFGRTLAIKGREFIEAAKAIGCTGSSIMGRHFVPHLLPLVVIYTGLGIATTVTFEATLSYLGAGVPRGTASLGALLFEGAGFWQTDPRLVLLPGLVVMALVLGFNLVSDVLRDALDPRVAERR